MNSKRKHAVDRKPANPPWRNSSMEDSSMEDSSMEDSSTEEFSREEFLHGGFAGFQSTACFRAEFTRKTCVCPCADASKVRVRASAGSRMVRLVRRTGADAASRDFRGRSALQQVRGLQGVMATFDHPGGFPQWRTPPWRTPPWRTPPRRNPPRRSPQGGILQGGILPRRNSSEE